MSNSAMILKAARDDLDDAQRHLNETLSDLYPVGSDVEWEIGGHPQNGEVLRNCYGDDLIVRNHRTGKERKISIFDILQAAGHN